MQNLENGVRLVKSKDTSVRFHVRSTHGIVNATAILRADRAGFVTYLKPVNKTYPAGSVYVDPDPDRGVLNDAFLFQLPAPYRGGSVTLTAEVNPNRKVPEFGLFGYLNNVVSTTVSFESVPINGFVVYQIGYKSGSTIIQTPEEDVQRMLKWVSHALPVGERKYWMRDHAFGKYPGPCEKVNAFLLSERSWDRAHNSGKILPWARYYGMVSDVDGAMTGCSADIPSSVASGPTGPESFGWDFDGSYGDWYGGHELGHTFGRAHAEFCGAKKGAKYPYPSGRISPTLEGPKAQYGFGMKNEIYGPDWTDMMTYCDYEWIGAFTYHGILNYMQKCMTVDYLASESCMKLNCPPTGWCTGPQIGGGFGLGAGERLLVTGSINPVTEETILEPLFVVTASGEVPESLPGDHAVVLRGADQAVLARHPFTPSEGQAGALAADEIPADRDVQVLFFNEFVPYVSGTARVDIEGPGGAVLASVGAGPRPPSVTVLSPNGGEVFDGETMPVRWTAQDPDGDPLVFRVQYSRDNGASWELIARDLTDSEVEIDRGQVPGGAQALVRVWASDGIHTAGDVSDATFAVANHVPRVEITEPPDGATFAAGQTVQFAADAYDVETGSMDGDEVVWRSDRDGELGGGATLAIETLTPGLHTVTITADDGEGGAASDSVSVSIVAELDDVPPPPPALRAEPLLLGFDPRAPAAGRRLYVDNPAGEPVRWRAAIDVPWVRLSRTEGETPARIDVAFDETSRPEGEERATITFTSPDLPDAEARVGVRVRASSACAGDCNQDGSVTIDELIRGVNIALETLAVDECAAFDTSGDGRVTIDELIAAVRAALNGC